MQNLARMQVAATAMAARSPVLAQPQPQPQQPQQPRQILPNHVLINRDVPVHAPRQHSAQVRALLTRNPAARVFPTPAGEQHKVDRLLLLPGEDRKPARVENIDPEQEAKLVYPLVVVTPAKCWGQMPTKVPLDKAEDKEQEAIWRNIRNAQIEEGWRQPCVLQGTCKAVRAERDAVDACLAKIAPSSPEMAARIDQRAALRTQALALATLNEHILRDLLPLVPEDRRRDYALMAREFSFFARSTVVRACASAGRSGAAAIQNRVANLRDKATALFSYTPVGEL
eukprot:jgi/Mesvir1/11922/Mv26120-RA.1